MLDSSLRTPDSAFAPKSTTRTKLARSVKFT